MSRKKFIVPQWCPLDNGQKERHLVHTALFVMKKTKIYYQVDSKKKHLGLVLTECEVTNSILHNCLEIGERFTI